jgi:hypothetical protein
MRRMPSDELLERHVVASIIERTHMRFVVRSSSAMACSRCSGRCSLSQPGGCLGRLEGCATARRAASIDGIWPREKDSIGTVTLYQPQVDNWDGVQVEFRSAVSVKANAEAPPVYGVVWGTTRTSVDKDARLVHLNDRQFTKVVFPSAADKQAAWKAALEKEVPQAIKEIALDRLAAALEVAAADRQAAAVPVRTTPRGSVLDASGHPRDVTAPRSGR